MRKFDLNIDKILEDWNVEHAIREIIANAIDEQKITSTQDVIIEKCGESCWSIRDFGRGIRYEHFVQNESMEKQSQQGIIGKFGIGLKDALATFDRHHVKVKIYSQFGDIRIERLTKGGFDDIITLHAIIEEPSKSQMKGTEFIIDGISNEDMRKAKAFFLEYSNSKILEKTKIGDIVERIPGLPAYIYVNGVKIASEDNFLFSYNITTLNTSLRKALNRERTNVGRTAYTPSVRNMLLESQNESVIDALSKDLQSFSRGTSHDELKWTDVQIHTSRLLNKRENVVFVTSQQMLEKNDIVHEAERASQIIVIPENLQNKLNKANEETGTETIKTIEVFVKERSANFEYEFVNVNNLSMTERANYELLDTILNSIGGKPVIVKQILISEKMQNDNVTFLPVSGLWDSGNERIIIKRSILNNLDDFVGTLLHELAHAKSGCTDATRGFESQLTNFLGVLGAKYIRLLNSK